MRNRIPIASEGNLIILTFVGSTLVCYLFNLLPLAGIFLFFSLGSIYFFRDPKRNPPFIPQAILAPADGKVLWLDTIYEGSFLQREVYRISIFLSLFDVHINRSPYAGQVISTEYKAGKFLPALWDKAARENEQNSILLASSDIGLLLIRQIAGYIARRIVCWVKPGDQVESGQKLGLIKFGSRVELLLPIECEICVKLGDKVKAGETIIAKVKTQHSVISNQQFTD
jgi:phosphatidylserine decarboxylase